MRLLFLVPALLLVAGCVPRSSLRTSGDASARPARTVRGVETRIQSDLDPMLGLDVYDAQDLYEFGVQALEDGNFTLGRVAFVRLLEEFPASQLSVGARFNLALSAERQGQFADAADFYLEYVAVVRSSEPEEAAELELHAGMLRWRIRDLPGAVVPLHRAVHSGSLSLSDQWHGRAILARIAGLSGDWKAGEAALDTLRRNIRRHTRTTREIDPWSSAMVWFHAAELYRDRALAQRLLDVDDLSAARRWLDDTAGWFLESRRCHKRVLEHRHPEWSGPAALALGRINEDFRDAMLTADTPTELSIDATMTYLRLLDEQTRAFLEKAVLDYRWLIMDSTDLRLQEDALVQLREALRRVEAQLELPKSTAAGPDGNDGKP